MGQLRGPDPDRCPPVSDPWCIVLRKSFQFFCINSLWYLIFTNIKKIIAYPLCLHWTYLLNIQVVIRVVSDAKLFTSIGSKAPLNHTHFTAGIILSYWYRVLFLYHILCCVFFLNNACKTQMVPVRSSLTTAPASLFTFVQPFLSLYSPLKSELITEILLLL